MKVKMKMKKKTKENKIIKMFGLVTVSRTMQYLGHRGSTGVCIGEET